MESTDPALDIAKLKMEDSDSPEEANGSFLMKKNVLLEQMIENEIFKITEQNIITNQVPELVILVPCSDNEHIPEVGGKGYFVIRGNKLMDVSRGHIGEKGEILLGGLQGCGYESCVNTALESIKDDISLPDEVSCSVKMPLHMVSLSDFCEEHDETNFPVLIISNLKDITAEFKKLSKILITKGSYRIPFALNESFSSNDSIPRKGPVFALSASSALSWANLINNKDPFLPALFTNTPSKLKAIIKDLHDHVLNKSPEFVSLSVNEEIEYLNKVTNMKKKNERINGVKRKVEEHSVDYTDAKKFKMEYGHKWYTSRKIFPDDEANAGLKSSFTDMALNCETHEVTLTQDRGSGNYRDVESIRTEVSRTWDRNFKCLACQNNHKIIDQDLGLNLVVSDQHFPAIIPCHGKSCVAVARFCGLTLPNLYRHILHPILKTRGNSVSADRHGATDLIQFCMSRGLTVTLMICSGTSLIKDGPACYTQTMQEIQYMARDRAFLKDGKEPLFRAVIFSAPLIPAVAPAAKTESTVMRLSRYNIEASNMGRLACLRASESKVMFISNTEFINHMASPGVDNTSMRAAMNYSFLCGLKAYPNSKVTMEMKTLKLPPKMVLPDQRTSTHEGDLKPGVLAEYSKAVHDDFNQVCLFLNCLFIFSVAFCQNFSSFL